MDSHSNFGYTTILTAPSPATSGTSLTVAAGTGTLFPATPFNCTVWPAGLAPLSTNAEIVRVTNVTGDTLTIQRAQEGTVARSILVGDQIANTITVKVFTDIETAIASALTTQTVQTQGMVSIQGSTGAISFANSNNVTFGFNASTITASFAGGGGGAAISAGTNSQSSGTVSFANSNGVTFGLSSDGSLTASHNGLTSQSNQAFSAAGGSSAFQTLNFRNANGISFSNSGGSVEGSYTVPSTAGLVSAINLSAGTTSNNLSAVTFSNSNGLTFGLNGSVVTASHNGITSQTVQTQSNVQGISAGTQAGRTGDVVFSNSNGISFGMSNSSIVTASYTVPSVAGLLSAVNLSGGTTSNNLSAMVFSNANNVSFGLNGSTITASASVASSQGSFNLSAGTTSNNLSAVTFGNSNGISFGLNAGTLTASVATSLTNINFSAGTTSNNLSAFVFSNSNNISFGMNGSTLTASVDHMNIGVSSGGNTGGTTGTIDGSAGQYVFFGGNNITLSQSVNAQSVTLSIIGASGGAGGSLNISAGSTSNNLTAVTFANSNNVSFGLNGSVVTASINEGTLSQFWSPDNQITTIGAPIVNSASVVFFPVYRDISMSRVDLVFSQSIGTAANNSTAAINYSATAVLLTRNGQTLNSIASTTNSSGVTWNSNNTASVTGAFFYSIPLATNLSEGNYWIAFQLSTNATGNTLTGAATTSLGNTMTMMGVGSAVFGAFSIRDLQAGSASSVGWLSAQGMNSSTGNLTAMSISNISAVGTFAQRAALAIRFTA